MNEAERSTVFTLIHVYLPNNDVITYGNESAINRRPNPS